jgi:hypothetical protein
MERLHPQKLEWSRSIQFGSPTKRTLKAYVSDLSSSMANGWENSLEGVPSMALEN